MSKAEQLEALAFVLALVSALIGIGFLTFILRR